jgi:predicted site-specific integrase-resolvase
MADTTDLLDQIRSIIREETEPLKERLDRQDKKLDEQGIDIKSVKQVQQEQGSEIKATRKEHGEKLDMLDGKVNVLDEKVDRLGDGQNRQHTILKVLEEAIKETKAEVDKLLRRPRQAD